MGSCRPENEVSPLPRHRDTEGDNLSASANHPSSEALSAPSPPLTLKELPEEIKIMILKTLPEPGTLNALVSSAPSFYRSYIANRESIMLSILPILCLDILTDVFYLQEARKLNRGPNWSVDVRSLLAGYHASRPIVEPLHLEVLRRANEEDLLAITEFHSLVQSFVDKFCKKTLAHAPTNNTETFNAALTKTETRRIHRAVYRFEIFCELFGTLDLIPDQDLIRNDGFGDSILWELFLSCFEKWEVEEIACIRDFIPNFYNQTTTECVPEFARMDLLQELATVGRNDPSLVSFLWPRMAGEWIEDYSERFVAPGLAYLMGTMMETTCTITRAHLMVEVGHPGSCHGYNFLTDVLQYVPYDHEVSTKASKGKTPKIKASKWTEDGANAAWHWSTQRINENYFEDRKKSLRIQGYVMWDLSRLKHWHSLKLACEESIVHWKPRS